MDLLDQEKYFKKYLKYKLKYSKLKSMIGKGIFSCTRCDDICMRTTSRKHEYNVFGKKKYAKTVAVVNQKIKM
jgi:hypothetical protein